MSTNDLHNIIEASIRYNKQIGSQFPHTTNVPHSFTGTRGAFGAPLSSSILAALSHPGNNDTHATTYRGNISLQSAKMSSIHSSLLPTYAPPLAIPMVEQLPLITNPFKILSTPSSVDFTIFCLQSCYSHNMLAKLAVILTLLNLPTTQYVRLNG